MSEAIIARGGKGSINSGSSNQLVTNIITNTTLFVVSDNVKDNKLYVRIFGAGGGGGCWNRGYGGSGYINNGTVYLTKGTSVYVTIGMGAFNDGSQAQYSGGTSSFGTHISAAGGVSGGPGGNNASGTGGCLYYNSSNARRISTTGSMRLYFGDGSNSASSPAGRTTERGSNGCCLITYVN